MAGMVPSSKSLFQPGLEPVGCRASPTVPDPCSCLLMSPLLSPVPKLCSAFTAEQATYNHVKLHHGYTNVIGLGDSSTWKLPFLNRYVYMFVAPLAVPIITPLVALGTCPAALAPVLLGVTWLSPCCWYSEMLQAFLVGSSTKSSYKSHREPEVPRICSPLIQIFGRKGFSLAARCCCLRTGLRCAGLGHDELGQARQ